MLRSTAWVLTGLIVLALNAPAVRAADLRRPNFLVFIADDMAWDDCGAYGHPSIQTPNLDRLAREGVRFDRAFLTCSSCSPSRASLLTGRYPHNTGAEQLHWPLPAEQVTVTEPLREAGYWTASAGKWHLGDAARSKFDQVNEGRSQWLATLRNRPRDRPFFLWMAFYDPHRPYQDDTILKPHKPDDVVVPPYLPDVPATRADLARYYDEINRMDGVIGDVLEELERQGEADRTFVVFLSDNGRPFPRAKTTLYDSGIKTPLLVRWPGHIEAGSRCASLVSTIDLGPTVLELAGVEAPDTFQGRSFAPLLENPQGEIREYLFAEHNWHDFDAHSRAVRSARYKYIRNAYNDVPLTPPADAVRSPTFQAMRRLRDAGELPPHQMTCFLAPRPAEELYDTEADPYELVNLAETRPELLRRFRQVLDRWEHETDDRIPAERTLDEFDRETGAPLPNRKPKRAP